MGCLFLLWLYEVERRSMGLDAVGIFFIDVRIRSESGSTWFPSMLHIWDFFLFFLNFSSFAFFSMLFVPFCFFSTASTSGAGQGLMADAARPGNGDTPARKVLTGTGFSGYTTRSMTHLLHCPLPQTRLQCNQNSPLRDSVNKWSSFSCQHHVSLDKGTVNTIMVPISNSF